MINKKNILIFLAVGVLGLAGMFFLKIKHTSSVFSRFPRDVLNNQTDFFENNYQDLQKEFKFWQRVCFIFDKLSFGYLDKKVNLAGKIDMAENIIENFPEIIGANGSKIYYVLLQNNMELRPTGGFMGSYAKIRFEKGGMKDLIVQDIYVPDGQIKGHVDPPTPIQEAFKQGWFRLRDANWDPDFPTAAQVVSWFFEKGNEEKPDGIIAVNLILAKDLLEITGPLNLIDYDLRVDQSNFYQVAQEYSETEFFPGSTQKAGIMGALVKTMTKKLNEMGFRDLLDVAKTVYKNLNEKQILIYIDNPKIQNIFISAGWDGAIKRNSDINGQFNDYLYLNESNLGANKANLYMSRKIAQTINIIDQNNISNRTSILFKNTSKYITPVKPSFWGGNYINYLRIFIPEKAKDIVVSVDKVEIPKEKLTVNFRNNLGLQEVGFFISVLAKTQSELEISYNLSSENAHFYSLQVFKQPGIESLPFSLKIIKNGADTFVFEKDLRTDTEIKAEI